MNLTDKLRKIRGKISQGENEVPVFTSDDVNLKTSQMTQILEKVKNDADISMDDLKHLAEHYGKQLSSLLDEIEGVVEHKSNSRIEIIADFIKVVQNADRIVEYPAIEKLVKEALKSLEE
ncbi:MAG TPA: hypothetical protein VJ508_01640 [Saprospiraceae bacterium]|nr:hypothetical protein [Saprospiraceae bacterium]